MAAGVWYVYDASTSMTRDRTVSSTACDAMRTNGCSSASPKVAKSPLRSASNCRSGVGGVTPLVKTLAADAADG